MSTDIYVGIKAVNSPSYVEHVFSCYREGKIAVPIFQQGVELPPQIKLSATITPDTAGGWFQPKLPENRSDDIAQISFSSGTEGTPKGIAVTHRALCDVVERLNRYMILDKSVREYIGVPVYYSFGFGRCRAIARVQGSAYIPSGGFSLLEFITMLGAGKVNALSAVPTLLRLIIAHESRFETIGQQLRWLEIGSQYISRDEKVVLMRIFPNAVILLQYGLTEASRSTLQVVSKTSGEALESVGSAEGEIEVDITTDGRIRLRGPNLASYIFKDGGVHSATDKDGWFTTNDIGYIKDGNLYFSGRYDDIINCSGVKSSAEVLEQLLSKEIVVASPLSVIGVPDALYGERIIVVMEEALDLDRGHVQAIAERAFSKVHPSLASAVSTALVKEIPRTATNKVRRKALKGMYLEGIETLAAEERDTAQLRRPASQDIEKTNKSGRTYEAVRKIVQDQLPSAEVGPSSRIDRLGGTSLDFVELELALESVLGTLPPLWYQKTLMELTSGSLSIKSLPHENSETRIDQLSARSLCCVMVVLVHVVGYDSVSGLQLPQSHWLQKFNAFAEYFRMPLFAFTAGLTFSMQATPGKEAKVFFPAAIKGLVVPTFATMFLFFLLSTAANTKFGAPEVAWWNPFIFAYAHFWFIQSLLVILFVSYLVCRYFEGASLWYYFLLIAVPILLPSLFHTDFLSIRGLAVLAPFFALGVLFNDPVGRGKRVVDVIWRYNMPLFVAAVALLGYFYIGSDKMYQMPHPAAFVIGLPLVLFVLRFASILPGLKFLAPYTFYIFLWHIFATSSVRRVLDSLGIEALGVHVILGLILGVAIPVIACLALKRVGLFKYLDGRW